MENALIEARPRLHVVPANETLAAAELFLAGRSNRHGVLAARLSAATEAYDYVVVDCSPSLSLMNQNALVLCDSVLVPVACDYLSLVGVRQVLKTIKSVNALLHHRLDLWAVLPTFYDARTKICVEALQSLRAHFKERCLSPVRNTTRLREAPASGQAIFEHAPTSRAADDYRVLVERLVADEHLAAAQAAPPGAVARVPPARQSEAAMAQGAVVR